MQSCIGLYLYLIQICMPYYLHNLPAQYQIVTYKLVSDSGNFGNQFFGCVTITGAMYGCVRAF